MPEDELQEYELARLLDKKIGFILIDGLMLSGKVERLVWLTQMNHRKNRSENEWKWMKMNEIEIEWNWMNLQIAWIA